MSSLKNLENLPSNNVPGDSTWDTKQTSSGWLAMNGQIVSQSSNPSLYAKIGLLTNGFDNWTARTSGTASDINALIYNGNNLYVYGGFGGALATSTDAITWTSRTSGTSSIINSIIYNGSNLYVYAGEAGVLATSTNAITWTSRTSETTRFIYSIFYSNNTYIYGNDQGKLATSTDAITWVPRSSLTSQQIFSLTSNGTTYVYGAGFGNLATTTKYTYNSATEFSLPVCNSDVYAMNTLPAAYTKNG